MRIFFSHNADWRIYLEAGAAHCFLRQICHYRHYDEVPSTPFHFSMHSSADTQVRLLHAGNILHDQGFEEEYVMCESSYFVWGTMYTSDNESFVHDDNYLFFVFV